MLYNLPILLSLFAMIGGLHYAVVESVHRDWLLFIPVITIIFGYIWSDLRGLAILILTFVASTVHGCVVRGITFLARLLCASSTLESNRFRQISISIFVTFSLVQIMGVAYSVLRDGKWSFLPLDMVMYMTVILLVHVSLFQMVGRHEVSSLTCCRDPTRSSFATLLVVVMPFSVAGQVLLIGWECSTRLSSWNFLLQTCGPILGACYVKRPRAGDSASNQPWQNVASFFLVIFILFWSPWGLPRGTGFRLNTLVRVISWADVALPCISSKITPHSASKE